MKKVLIGIFLLGMVGCEASEVVENEVNNIPLENLEDQQVENEEIEYSLESESLLKIKYPSTWYFYSFDGGAGSMMYFTDKGISEYKEELYNRSHDDLNFANECLLNIIWRIDNVDYKRKKLNTKIDPKEKEECENVLNELEKQIPEKNEKALEYLTHTQKIENELINYTSLDNCGNYYKDDINRKIYYVIGDMYREILEVIDADYNTFEVVSKCSIAKDKNNEYIDGEIVSSTKSENLDKETQTSEKPLPNFVDVIEFYKNSMNTDETLEGVDKDSLEELVPEKLYRDKNYFWDWKDKEKVNTINNFKLLNCNVYKYGNKLYNVDFRWKDSVGRISEPIDTDSLQYSQDHGICFFWDNHNMYYLGPSGYPRLEKIANLKPINYTIFNQKYFINDYGVFTLSEKGLNKLENADPESFEYVNENLTKDNKRIFFAFLENSKHRNFFNRIVIKEIEDADVQTFKFLEEENIPVGMKYKYEDKNAVYTIFDIDPWFYFHPGGFYGEKTDYPKPEKEITRTPKSQK